MTQPIYVVAVPCTGLYAGPNETSPIETEALYGERVRIVEESVGWMKVVTELDNYPGYVRMNHLLAEFHVRPPTHMVSEPQVAVYREPNFRSASSEDRTIFMNSRVHAANTAETPEGAMLRLQGLGWVFMRELRPIDSCAPDFVTEAMKFLGTRYRWGWRTRGFIECSALLQAGCIAAGIPCPRNVKQQVEMLGEPIAFASDFSNLVRGDLVFWTAVEGKSRHVAIMIDAANALHATIAAPYGGTVLQPLEDIVAEQLRDGNGPVTFVRRFPDYRPA